MDGTTVYTVSIYQQCNICRGLIYISLHNPTISTIVGVTMVHLPHVANHSRRTKHQ